MPSLTAHLLSLDEAALLKATTHPFLAAAATESLPLPQLQLWLAQDRLYALTYINFIGALLAQTPVASPPPGPADRASSLEWRVADCLIDCLTNIRTELRLFEDTARAEGWLAAICGDGVREARPTRCYRDLFAGATAQGRPLIVGLVVLWATEESYLQAWKHARGKMEEGKGKGGVMARVFIPNWSSAEFEAFVRRIGGLVNRMAIVQGVEEGGSVWRECEAAWRQVLWAEAELWPDVEVNGK